MKLFHKSLLILWMAGALLILAAGQARAAPGDPSATLPVVINEIMPKPEHQNGAWVELYVGEHPQRIFLPLTLLDGAGDLTAAMINRPGVNLAGWQVSNEWGFAYILPDALTSVPNDTLILILFVAFALRTYNVDWADGQLPHPDERSTIAFYAPTIRWPSVPAVGATSGTTGRRCWPRTAPGRLWRRWILRYWPATCDGASATGRTERSSWPVGRRPRPSSSVRSASTVRSRHSRHCNG